jgi:effector-binding domain-containing protein
LNNSFLYGQGPVDGQSRHSKAQRIILVKTAPMRRDSIAWLFGNRECGGSKEMSMNISRQAATLAVLAVLGMGSPALAQPPGPAPKGETTVTVKEPFGVEIDLTPKTIIYLKGNSTWDKALESLQDAFKSVYTLLDKQGIQRAGPAMTIYTEANDTGFSFQAAVPIADVPKDPPKGDIAVGQSPGGRAMKFMHRGSYDSMDNTYEAITNFLDERRLEATEAFIEEYETDPVTTPEDKFVVTVYVPLK